VEAGTTSEVYPRLLKRLQGVFMDRTGKVARRAWLVAIFALITQAASAAIPDSERQALINLYTSTNGADWTTSTNWNGSAGTECTWYGVTCDSTQSHVTRLDLNTNHLTGSLSALQDLTNLNFLFRRFQPAHRHHSQFIRVDRPFQFQRGEQSA
jgi:Leucine rich repeat N-terminal domain